MKTKLIGVAAAVAFACGGAALAQQGAGTTTRGSHVCLWTYQIDHTHVMNPRTVLFYMKDGHVWRNDLKAPCRGLEFHGFDFVSRSDTICGPEVGIRVIRTGEACSLGEFSPYMHASR